VGPLDFWFEFASTYSYLAVNRIEPAAAAAGLAVRWRPFLLGPIFAAQGWSDSPFNLYPAKGAYMWRDMERLCARDRLPWRRPSAFPRNGVAAARITLALPEAERPAFVKAVYHANFALDRDIADAAILAGILDGLGLDPDAIPRRAHDPAVKARLRGETEEAIRLGIFGAPTFVIGGEMFWGNDRLDDAIAWA